MSEITFREMFFLPDNLALTLVTSFFLGFLFDYQIFYFLTPPHYIDINAYFLTITVILGYSLFVKTDQDSDDIIERNILCFLIVLIYIRLRKEVKIPDLNVSETFSFAICVTLILFMTLWNFLLYSHFIGINDSLIFYELDTFDRRLMESLRSIDTILFGISVAFEIFLVNQVITILSKAKSRAHMEEINGKLDLIIKKMQ